MENIKVEADAAYCEQLGNYVDEMYFKSVFQKRYGRGWQRKLGTVLGVPETTVNGWFKSDRFSALVKLAFGILLSREMQPSKRWIPVKNGASYAICDTQGPVGRVVADNILSLDDAMLIAAAPQLHEACGDVFVVIDDAKDCFEGWPELAKKLGVSLDAASYGRSEAMDKEDG